MNKKAIDLSSVFCSEPDEGQAAHARFPDEVWLHFAAAFAAKAGLCEHPGVYSGPDAPPKE